MQKHVQLLLSQIGVKEIKGIKDNPQIIKYFDEIGFNGKQLKDETAWCSAFANWIAKTSGLKYSGKLDARSWINTGCKVKPSTARVGDVLVFWRVSKSDWRGHVGFYINEDDDNYYVLGGNQSNSVCIKPYPKHRLLSIQRI